VNIGERNRREARSDESFCTGCAVSPFKSTEAETFAQYYKLCKKIAAGARFVITQVGSDVRKFRELLQIRQVFGLPVPILGSVDVLRPPAAKIMNRGAIPGAVVTDTLLEAVRQEWQDKEQGEATAVERAARLAVVLKGLGCQGVHVGSVHKSFNTLSPSAFGRSTKHRVGSISPSARSSEHRLRHSQTMQYGWRLPISPERRPWCLGTTTSSIVRRYRSGWEGCISVAYELEIFYWMFQAFQTTDAARI
jgi:hypothetical protein